jgi:hypothetical protein
MGTGAEKGIVTVLFNSFTEQEKGGFPRRDPAKETERFPSILASDAAGAPRRKGRIGRAVDHRGSPQTLYVKPSVALGYFVSFISEHCVCWM